MELIMDLKRTEGGRLSLVLTEDQLHLLQASIHETFGSMNREDFKYRIQADPEQVLAMGTELMDLLEGQNIDV